MIDSYDFESSSRTSGMTRTYAHTPRHTITRLYLFLFAVDHHQVSTFALTVFSAVLPCSFLGGEEVTLGVNVPPIGRTSLRGHTITQLWRTQRTNERLDPMTFDLKTIFKKIN